MSNITTYVETPANYAPKPFVNPFACHICNFDHVSEPHFCPSVDIQVPPTCSSHCTEALAHRRDLLTGSLDLSFRFVWSSASM